MCWYKCREPNFEVSWISKNTLSWEEGLLMLPFSGWGGIPQILLKNFGTLARNWRIKGRNGKPFFNYYPKNYHKYLLYWVIICWNPEANRERFLHMNKMFSLSISTSKPLCFHVLDWSWSKTIFQIAGWKVKIKTSFNSHAVHNLSELKIWTFLFLFYSFVTVCKVRPSLGYFHGIW